MSVWGGIGEGIAQGLKERMDREDQERRERMAQFNADRQFRFAREQAERAQANADRTFEAGREDAARSQANADRTFAAQERQRGVENERADYELALKDEAQDWSNKINEEKLRQFRLANEQMDAELRKKREREQLSQETAARQWVFATARMLRGTSGREETWNVQDKPGVTTQVKGRIIDGDEFYGMFGKDSDLVKQGFYGVAMTEDENGRPMFTLLNNNPQMDIVKNEDAMYDTYNGEYPGLGDEYFRGVKQNRDLGVLAQTKKIETDEAIRRDNASGLIGRRSVDALQSILKAADSGLIELSDEQKKMVTDMIPQIASSYSMANANAGAGASTGAGRVQTPEEAARARAALEQKRAAQKRITAPTAKKPTEPKKDAAKPTEKKVEQKPTEQKKEDPKKAPIPIQRKRRHGSETSNGSAFEINEEAVAARMKREQEEEENRNRDREEFYRRMNSGNQIASASKRRN